MGVLLESPPTPGSFHLNPRFYSVLDLTPASFELPPFTRYKSETQKTILALPEWLHEPSISKAENKPLKGLEAKGSFSCLGLQVRAKRACQITINYSFLQLIICDLNNLSYYLNIIFQSYIVFITSLSVKKP